MRKEVLRKDSLAGGEKKQVLGGMKKKKVIRLCTVRVAEKKRLGPEKRWRDKGGGGEEGTEEAAG